MASDAQMKRSTWSYFQRESAFPLSRKSTRLAATSLARFGWVLIDSASAAIATP